MTAVLIATPRTDPAVEPRPVVATALPQGARFPAELDRLPTIGLAELSAQGELLTRKDRKYLVDVALLPRFLDAVSSGTGGAAALEIDGRRWFSYESRYHDTPALTSYLQATRRRPRRFKVRSRTYLESGLSFLEVKTRDGRRRTVKERTTLSGTSDSCGPQLDPDARGFVASRLGQVVGEPGDVASALTHTLSTHYRRATLFLPADDARVTIDLDVSADRDGARLELPGLAIVETKTTGRACGGDRVLWRLGQRPVKVSKYATSLAALDPDLPAAKWLPALRRMGVRPHSLAMAGGHP